MSPSKKNEISEAILHIAFKDNFEREMAALSAEGETSLHEFSARHETQMRKLFRTQRWRELSLSTYKVAKRVAAIVLVAVTLLFGALLTNQDVRASVVRTIVEWYQQFTWFRFEGHVAPLNIEGWRVTYLPDGFVEHQNITLGNLMTIIEFTNDQNETIVLEFAYSEATSISVDNENARYEMVLYHGMEMHVFHDTSGYQRNNILWHNLGYAFLLQSYLPVEDMLRIAVSVVPIQ